MQRYPASSRLTHAVVARVIRPLLILLLTAACPVLHAITVSEGPDFPNNPDSAATYTLELGTNTFSGTLQTTADGQDHFKVNVPSGMRITQASKSVSGGGFNGFASFNLESISGTGAANFTGAFATPYPLPSGVYSGFVNADFSTGTSWSITITVGAAPQYTVTASGGSMTVTDTVGNGDTLDITQPAAGQIKFAAAGRTFSVNGGALITGDSGNVSLSGITSLTLSLGGGADTVNVGAFSGASFPAFSYSTSGNDDTVNVNGDLTLASDRDFEIINAATLNMAAGANVLASGTGEVFVDCTRNVSLGAGASLETVNGDLWVEANQQLTAATGNFIGVNLDGAGAMLRTTGTGALTVKGRGGNDAGGSQLGISLFNSAKIIGGTTGAVNVTGTGGASTNFINRGVTVYGTGSAITSSGAPVNVTGTAGAVGSYFGIGVAMLFGGEISAAGSGAVTVTGTGAGAGDSGFNVGVEMGGAGSKITSGGGTVSVLGTAGTGGDSFGVLVGADAIISAPVAGGNIVIEADSLSVNATAAITTAAAASTTSLQTRTSTTRVDLGAADDNTGTPKVLGLTDAELDRITTPELIISSAGAASLNVSAALSPASAPNLTLKTDAGTGSVKPTVAGTDATVTGTLKLDGPLSVPVTSATVDTGFPQLKVDGGVNLNGRALDLTGTTLAGTPGQTFTIVDNDGSDGITGTFASLPQDAQMAWPGSPALRASISYTGGTGNDVVLTLVNALEVTTTADGTGTGSLRDAIAAAASVPGGDTVTFAPSLSGQTITLATEIVIADADEVAVDASSLPGGITLSGGNVTRHFSVPAGKFLVLKNLTLTGGNSGGGAGGAILSLGLLHAYRCTFSGNTSGFGGGAITTLYASSQLVLENCTLAENAAGFGGAIWHDQSVAIFIHCTVARNNGSGGTGGIVLGAGNAVFHNTLVAENTGTADPDLGGSGATLTLFGRNLFGQHETTYASALPVGTPNAGGHYVGTAAAPVNARLAPFAAYGGPTKTCALLPGSPALDQGAVVVGYDPATDQRGLIRVRDGNAVAGALPDIGAYEAQLAPYAIGFNLGDASVSGGDTLTAGEIAGAPGFTQGNWNHLAGANSGLPANTATRTDATGATLSGLKLWWRGANTWRLGGTADTPDKKLMFGYLDSNATGDGTTATDLFNTPAAQPYLAIASLPAAATLGGYRVLVYSDTDNTTGRISRYWLTTNRAQNPASVASESPLTGSLFTRDTANFSGAYTRATATTDTGATTPGGNYFVFENLSETGGFIVRAEEGSLPATGQARAPVNAVQIVRNEIIVVTTAADENDPTGTLGTGISLREAIRDAAPASGIVFDPVVFNGEPADIITFLATNPGLVLDKNLTVDASNITGGVTVNAAGSFGAPKRVFHINTGSTSSLLGMNIQGGYDPSSDGGAGVLNHGHATLIGCRISGNTATYGSGVTSRALSAPSSLLMRRCTVTGNTALSQTAGVVNWADTGHAAIALVEDSSIHGNTGSGVENYTGGGNTAQFTLLRCTISGNTGYNGAGAINNSFTAGDSCLLSLRHCTVSGNTASNAAGGIVTEQNGGTATLTLEHTIVADNTATAITNGKDVYKSNGSTVVNAGGNLIGINDTVTTEFPAGALVGTSASPRNPLLAPLGDYGGPTQTHALLPTSPARNAATGSTAITDQRGFPIVGTADTGAYEAGTFTSFNAWAWETIPSTNPAHHAPGYDYDGDGRSLLLEFAGQFSPTTPEGGEVMSFTRDTAGTLATLVMPYRPSVPGLIYTIERSTTLGAWTTVVTVNSGTNVAGGFLGGIALTGNTSTALTFTDTFITGQPRVFYRLRVTHP